MGGFVGVLEYICIYMYAGRQAWFKRSAGVEEGRVDVDAVGLGDGIGGWKMERGAMLVGIRSG